MANRTLTWHFPGSVVEKKDKVDVGIRYFADQDYVPVRLIIVAKSPPVSGQTIIDIKRQFHPGDSSASSIFGATKWRPQLQAHEDVLITDRFFNGGVGIGIPKDSIITIGLPDVGPGCADMTVHLELEAN